MNETILVEAIYENGVLKPTQPLSFTEQQVVKISLNSGTRTAHPHITKTSGICGGRPVVRGLRIPLRS
jgi:predicted DNA-binding antitoxin AbrB/MazE fold protein